MASRICWCWSGPLIMDISLLSLSVAVRRQRQSGDRGGRLTGEGTVPVLGLKIDRPPVAGPSLASGRPTIAGLRRGKSLTVRPPALLRSSAPRLPPTSTVPTLVLELATAVEDRKF